MTAPHAIILGSFYTALAVGAVLELRSRITDPKPGEDLDQDVTKGAGLIHFDTASNSTGERDHG